MWHVWGGERRGVYRVLVGNLREKRPTRKTQE